MKNKNDSVPSNTTDISAVQIMTRTLVSTTIRVFLPTLGLFGIGFGIDYFSGYKPYGMIIGASTGIIVAALLVAHQLLSLRKERQQ